MEMLICNNHNYPAPACGRPTKNNGAINSEREKKVLRGIKHGVTNYLRAENILEGCILMTLENVTLLTARQLGCAQRVAICLFLKEVHLAILALGILVHATKKEVRVLA